MHRIPVNVLTITIKRRHNFLAIGFNNDSRPTAYIHRIMLFNRAIFNIFKFQIKMLFVILGILLDCIMLNYYAKKA